LGASLADGGYLRALGGVSVLAPIVAFLLGAALAGLRPLIGLEAVTGSVLVLMVMLVVASVAAGLGLWTTMGWTLTSLVVAPIPLWESTFDAPGGWTLLAGRTAVLVEGAVVASVLVGVPLMTTTCRAAIARALRRFPKLALGVAALGSGLVAGLGTFSWVQVAPLLVRPLFLWPDGSTPSVEAIAPVQQRGWVLMVVAVVLAVARTPVEAALARRARVVHIAGTNPRTPATGGLVVRAVVSGILTTLLLGGLYATWLVAAVALIALIGLNLLRTVVLPAIPGYSRVLSTVPVLLRVLVVAIVTVLVGRVLVLGVGFDSSTFHPVLWTVLVSMAAAAAILPRPVPGAPRGRGRRPASGVVLVGLGALIGVTSTVGDLRVAFADNCSSVSDCFLNIPFLLGLGLAIGVALFFLGGWLGVGGWFGIGFIVGWSGGIAFGTPLSSTDPNNPNVAHNQNLIDQGANTRPPGTPGGPTLQDIANAANPSGGTNNCGSIASAIDSVLGGQAASETGFGSVNDYVLMAQEGATWQSMPSGGAPGDFLSGALDSPGDRGIVQFNQDGAAHVVNAVNIDGTVWYIDGQTHTVSSNIADIQAATGYTSPDSVTVLQTHP
jgi:hypothetical protein